MVCEYAKVVRANLSTVGDCAGHVDWIRHRLRPPDEMVASSWVPDGFEAYARILHPVEEREGAPPIRWSDVSRWSAVPLVPGVQWLEIALPAVTPPLQPPWTSQGPREGSLSRADATALTDVLAPFSSGNCKFAIWSGYGDHPTPRGPGDGEPRRVAGCPAFTLPWRDYEFYEGPVAGATHFERPRFQSPNLWWSDDHSWCVASEIDSLCTYIAGPRGLIDAVLATPLLEAVAASPDESLRRDLPTWLATRIAEATREVLQSGSVEVDFAIGTVTVSLERLGRNTAVLTTRSDRVGGWSGSTTPVRTRPAEGLRREVGFCVERAVYALVQG